jgi:aminoglycoside phosphotransferase (APT) family kinase protein
MQTQHPRRFIHYWKCDRPAAFHGTDARPRDSAEMMSQLAVELRRAFPSRSITVRVAPSQGNHLTFIAAIDGTERFVRIEDGPEHDDYLQVESEVMKRVRSRGVPIPEVIACDASREHVPFAWQVLEKIPHPDLNRHAIAGTLHATSIARGIGTAVATWQGLQPTGFGPYDPAVLLARGELQGFHESYADYFRAQLDRHLRFLTERQFISATQAREFATAIEEHSTLLAINRGCLVHKDLALWNILGTPAEIVAFIDFDDAISGDAMDDLSLLACFHDGTFLAAAMEGYESVRSLPAEHERRFWLHLLRNMIVKSVIRVGAGYFERSGDFFLTGGSSGAQLKTFTLERLTRALRGLRDGAKVSDL